MTRVLVLGGTGWLSGRIVRRWLSEGASVTCVARGARPAPEGAHLVRGDRDHPDAYDGVAGEEWDEVVDVSSQPEQVSRAIAVLGERAAHWSYVSSVSVYAANDVPGADESAALAPPAVPGEEYDYSRAKSAAEAAVRTLGDRVAITRPGLIVGAGDPSDRFGYWPGRFALAGAEPVLVPEAEGRYAQVIDVDDLTEFIVSRAALGWNGVVNAVGPSVPLGEVLDAARAAAGHTGPVEIVPDDVLIAQGVSYWAGPRSLPLWLPGDLAGGDMAGFATRDGRAFLHAGGATRPIGDSLRAVLADERERGLDRPRRAGLSRAEELAVLAAR